MPRNMVSIVRDLYRTLPESVRARLQPLDAIDELSSYLPSRPRLTLQEMVGALGAARRALLQPSMLVELTGLSRATGEPLRMLTDLTGEADAYWTGLLFAAPPGRAELGELRGWSGLGGALCAHADVPIMLLRHDRFVSRRVRELGAFTLPSFVDSFLDVHPPLERMVVGEQHGRSSRKTDVRRIRAQGIEAELSRRPGDIATLVREWNEPYVRARHGACSTFVSPSWQRRARRFCEVLWVHRRGERLGGVVLEPQGRVLRMVVLGVSEDGAVRGGATAALYYYAIREAVRRGFTTVHLGGSRPVLSDGVLAYKRKWGAYLRPFPPRRDYLALRLAPGHPSTRAFLAACPLIVETADGLSALTAPPGEERGDIAEVMSMDRLRGRIAPVGDQWVRYTA